MPGALELCVVHGRRRGDGENFQAMILREAFRLSFSSPRGFYQRMGDTRADAVLWRAIGNVARRYAVAVFGAYDLEFAYTQRLLDNMGIPYVVSRNETGVQVEFYQAYSGEMTNVEDLQGFLDKGRRILLLVETGIPKDLRLPEDAIILHFDHHQQGDPGYGIPPERVFQGSSFLQLWIFLQVLYDRPIEKEHLAVALGDHCLEIALGRTLFDERIRISVLINEIRVTAGRIAPYGKSFPKRARFIIALSQARRDFVHALERIRHEQNPELLQLGEGISFRMMGIMEYNSPEFFGVKVAAKFTSMPVVILRRIIEKHGKIRFSPMFFYPVEGGKKYMEKIVKIGEEEGWEVFGKDVQRGFTLWEGSRGWSENIMSGERGSVTSFLFRSLDVRRNVA